MNYRSLAVPPELAAKSNLRTSPPYSHVHINPKHGGGYPANIEGLHHLHCLNVLRMSLYYNYEHYSSLKKGLFVNKPAVAKLHVCESPFSL